MRKILLLFRRSAPAFHYSVGDSLVNSLGATFTRATTATFVQIS